MPSNCWEEEEPWKSKQCLIDGGDYIRKGPLAFGQGEQTRWSAAPLRMERRQPRQKAAGLEALDFTEKGPR